MAKFIKDKHGKFAGSLGDGKTAVPTSADDSPVRSWDIPGNADFARSYETTYQAYLRATSPHPEDPTPGIHPIYGGLNWGIQYSPEWGDWTVNHGYFGQHEEHARTGEVFIDGSDVPLASNSTRWTADAKTEEFARIIWEHRDQVTDGLVAQGFTPFKAVRVTVKIDENTGAVTVYPFDFAEDFTPFPIRL